MLYEQAKRRLKQIEKEIPAIENKLQGYPEENLIVAGAGTNTKWYKTLNGKKEYLPKSRLALASNLAGKKYLSKKLMELEEEKKALSNYLKKTSQNTADDMFTDYRYKELLQREFAHNVPDIEKWRSEEYQHSEKYPERLVHRTYAGHMVRSKSETMIANALYIRKIPYRYECLLELEGQEFYPDFTILHPQTRRIWYYEHFGKMDDPEYVKKVSSKLWIYSRNGLFMGQNLIATFETEKNPLDISQVEQLIQYYFE